MYERSLRVMMTLAKKSLPDSCPKTQTFYLRIIDLKRKSPPETKFITERLQFNQLHQANLGTISCQHTVVEVRIQNVLMKSSQNSPA